MANLDEKKYKSKCGAQISSFFDLVTKSVCRTDEEVTLALKDFQVKMLEGVYFHTSRELGRNDLLLSKAIVELVGEKVAGINEIRALAYKVFADSFRNGVDPTKEQYLNSLHVGLCEYLENTFDYLGPCVGFRFEENANGLRTKFISIVPAEEIMDRPLLPSKGRNWVIRQGDGFRQFVGGQELVVELGGYCWLIHSNSPKENVRQDAKWLSDVFVSYLRLSIRPADYCHRAKIGELEGHIFSELLQHGVGLSFNKKSWNGGSFTRLPQYKVDDRFSQDFHSRENQEKLSKILAATPNSIGKRVGDGLGWLSRGRQSADYSERLLYFFTALEALLSENSSFSPVAETIARYTSVILASDVKHRFGIYDEMKGLYQLRSGLVHRGVRSAHLLHSNNVQHYAESCFAIVLNNVDLSSSHQDFLAGLKKCSHGEDWPSKP